MSIEDLKKFIEAVGVIGGVLNTAVLGVGTWLLGTVTSSPTTQGYIRIFVILGGLAGAWFTFTGSAGTGRTICLRRRARFGIATFILFGIGILLISLTEGGLLRYLPKLAGFRDFLLDNNLIANFSIGLAAGLGMYFLMGAIVLSFPKLWEEKLGGADHV
jgi:hypothetical protein